MRLSKQEAKVFVPKRVNRKKQVLYKLVLLTIAVLVLVGTVYPFYRVYFPQAKDFFLNNLSLKINNEGNKNTSFEEKLRVGLEGRLEVLNITSSSEGTKAVLLDGTQVWFSPEKDLEQELRSLQTLLSKATIENRKLKRVDFRFSKVVLEYQ